MKILDLRGDWDAADRNLLDRKLIDRISGSRDVSVMSVTGYDTFVSGNTKVTGLGGLGTVGDITAGSTMAIGWALASEVSESKKRQASSHDSVW